MPKTGATETARASRGSIVFEPCGYLWNTHNIADVTNDKIRIPSQSFQWNGETNVVQENVSIFLPKIWEVITNYCVNYLTNWWFELKLKNQCWVCFTYLRFITNPRLCVEKDQRKSTASVLLQHIVKGAVIKSASPLTRFEIIPFHCSVSTVHKSNSKLLFLLSAQLKKWFRDLLGRARFLPRPARRKSNAPKLKIW